MKYRYIDKTDSKIPVPECLSDCVNLIRSDYYRYTGQKSSLFKMFLYSIVAPNFGFNFWFRLCSVKGWQYPFSRFMHRMYYLRYGIQIVPGTLIGYGFYISHGNATFINPAVIIGNNCNVSQCSTLGSNKGLGAIIGDNVYIGPNVCLIDDVCIGSNTTIGAGSIVTKDIPAMSVAVGNPSKVIKHGISYNENIHNRWI